MATRTVVFTFFHLMNRKLKRESCRRGGRRRVVLCHFNPFVEVKPSILCEHHPNSALSLPSVERGAHFLWHQSFCSWCLSLFLAAVFAGRVVCNRYCRNGMKSGGGGRIRTISNDNGTTKPTLYEDEASSSFSFVVNRKTFNYMSKCEMHWTRQEA